MADRGWRGLLWKGSSANSGGPRWRRGRATRRSAVARATEKAAAETAASETAAATVVASAPARAPFSQCAILTSVDVLKWPENVRRVTYLLFPSLSADSLPLFSRGGTFAPLLYNKSSKVEQKFQRKRRALSRVREFLTGDPTGPHRHRPAAGALVPAAGDGAPQHT